MHWKASLLFDFDIIRCFVQSIIALLSIFYYFGLIYYKSYFYTKGEDDPVDARQSGNKCDDPWFCVNRATAHLFVKVISNAFCATSRKTMLKVPYVWFQSVIYQTHQTANEHELKKICTVSSPLCLILIHQAYVSSVKTHEIFLK